MDYTRQEVLQFIEENDVKFIRLAFCDIFGTLKNISIMAQELPRAFEEGIAFQASAVRGFHAQEDDTLLLYPDPNTLTVLPWRPRRGCVVRLLCDIRYPNGTPYEGDVRHLLRQTLSGVEAQGFQCLVGLACEFYLFEADEAGNPTRKPQDKAGYLDIAPLDKGENIRREICLALEEMGIQPESSHHERGPGQNEIDFKAGNALKAADDFITFKSTVKTLAAQNGLYASFSPKPLPDKSGNGLHFLMTLFHQKQNQFDHLSDTAAAFVEGILNRAREITAFLNPTVISYTRFGCFEAPRFVSWSSKTKSQLVRIPTAPRSGAAMELRSPDAACNPYLAICLLLAAGMEGVYQKKKLRPPAESAQKGALFEQLPQDLAQAVAIAKQSAFIANVLPQTIAQEYLSAKEDEWAAYEAAEEKGALLEETCFSVI